MPAYPHCPDDHVEPAAEAKPRCCSNECGAPATHVEPDGDAFHCAFHAHEGDALIAAAEEKPEAVYHPDPAINAGVAMDMLAAETADLAAGYPPRRWLCRCGASHSRGHFLSVGQHRCLSCGYVGDGGVMIEQDGRP